MTNVAAATSCAEANLHICASQTKLSCMSVGKQHAAKDIAHEQAKRGLFNRTGRERLRKAQNNCKRVLLEAWPEACTGTGSISSSFVPLLYHYPCNQLNAEHEREP
eukprot:TRINITY_DN11316_c0_g1_i3.p2 TRINITY_DN11316_c0_g1~~TRINITY_DN11316_c0_g1_i3.p2  ORF type:complete len:106 (-),score=4.59 TRINITY_DN11316_c0_g1_i3:516-833(-)